MGAVVWVEFPSIQGFIFRSRTLLDTIGRSRLIAELSAASFVRQWPGQIGDVWAQGAGSFGAEFASVDEAREFVGWFTRQVREGSDALHPVVAIVDDATLPSSSAAAPGVLRAARHTTAAGVAGEGAWGSVLCPVTGVPAAGSRLTSRVSGEPATAKCAEVVAAEQRGRDWHAAQHAEVVPAQFRDRVVLPAKLDELGRQWGESSKLAVIVADLNGVGALLSEVAADRRGEAGSALSALISSWCSALVAAVCERISFDGDHASIGDRSSQASGRAVAAVELSPASWHPGRWFLPMRPWVSAGDDVVLVCESRLAWWLAEQMVEWLDADPADADDPRARVDALLGCRPTVSFGISIVPVGVSLSRAHRLAAAVCEHAKTKARSRSESSDAAFHGLDWHRGVLDAASLQEYRADRSVGGAVLTRRPFVWSREDASTGFSSFAHAWLGDDERSLRGPAWSQLRSTVRDTLLTAITAGKQSATDTQGPSDALGEALAQVNTRRRIMHRRPVDLPAIDAAAFLDALDLRDEYLRLS